MPGSLPVFSVAVSMLCVMKSKDNILCEYCRVLYSDIVLHKAIVCPNTNELREEFFTCLTDYFSVYVSSYINNLEDEVLLQTLLGACDDTLDTLLTDEQYCYLLYLCSLYLFNLKCHVK